MYRCKAVYGCVKQVERKAKGRKWVAGIYSDGDESREGEHRAMSCEDPCGIHNSHLMRCSQHHYHR